MARDWTYCCFVSLLVVTTGTVNVQGAQPAHGGAPVYQRRSTGWQSGHPGAEWHHSDRGHGSSKDHGHRPQRHHSPKHQSRQFHEQASSFSFQRPYPYHLDYYRMKYGGSYAPYFGNLYGPPKVYAPAYLSDGGYGPWGDPGYGPPASGYVEPGYPLGPHGYGPPPTGEPVGTPPVQLSTPTEGRSETLDPRPAGG